MTTPEQARVSMKPSEYNDFIEQIEIRDLNLVSATITKFGYVEKPPNLTISVQTKAWYENGKGQFTAFHRYNMNMKDIETKEQVAKLSAVFAVTYQSKLLLTEQLFDIFKEVNLSLNTWPYFREFAHNVFARMNLPQVVAPAFKVMPRRTRRRL